MLRAVSAAIHRASWTGKPCWINMKTDEEIARELQQREFQEIDVPAEPVIIIAHTDQWPAQHAGFQPYEVQPQVAIPSDARNYLYAKVISFSRVVKWIAVIDMVLSLIYVIGGWWPFIFLVLFPVLGFLGAMKLNSCMTLAYLIYLGVSVLLRIILVAVSPTILFLILAILVTAFEIYLFVFVLRFFRLLRQLTPMQRQEILTIRDNIT